MIVIVRFEYGQVIIFVFVEPMTAWYHFWALICATIISESNFFSLIIVMLIIMIILLNINDLLLGHFLSLECLQQIQIFLHRYLVLIIFVYHIRGHSHLTHSRQYVINTLDTGLIYGYLAVGERIKVHLGYGLLCCRRIPWC